MKDFILLLPLPLPLLVASKPSIQQQSIVLEQQLRIK